MRLSKTTRFSRHTYGDDGVFGRRNIVSASFGATDLGKVEAGSGDEYLDGVATGTHNVNASPRIPRSVVVVGAEGDSGNVVVTGRNSEGAVISETIALDGDTPVDSDKAFASVTTVVTPADTEVSAGYGSKLGVNHRLLAESSVQVLVIEADNSAELEDADAVTRSTANVENNTVVLDTSPDGVKQFRVYTLTYSWHADPINANPVYGV